MNQQTAIEIIDEELKKDTLTDHGRKLLTEFRVATETGRIQKMLRLQSEIRKAKANLIFYKEEAENKKEEVVWTDISDDRLSEIEKINPRARELIATLIEMKSDGSTDTKKFKSIQKELEKIEKKNGSLGCV